MPKQYVGVSRAVLRCNHEHRVELAPGEEKLVSLTAMQHRRPLRNTELVWAPEDDDPIDCFLVDGVEMVGHEYSGLGVMLPTTDDGIVSVCVTNTTHAAMAFEAGEGLLALRYAKARRVDSSNIPENIWSTLSSDEKDRIEAYQVMLGGSCRPTAGHGVDDVIDDDRVLQRDCSSGARPTGPLSHQMGAESNTTDASTAKEKVVDNKRHTERECASSPADDPWMLHQDVSTTQSPADQVISDTIPSGRAPTEMTESSEAKETSRLALLAPRVDGHLPRDVGNALCTRTGARRTREAAHNAHPDRTRCEAKVSFDLRQNGDDADGDLTTDFTTRSANRQRRHGADHIMDVESERSPLTRGNWLSRRRTEELNEGREARRLLRQRRLHTAAAASASTMETISNATFEQVLSGKHNIVSIDPAVFKRDDVLPRIVLYAGLGGVT